MELKFSHKGLRELYSTGSKKGIETVLCDKLSRILTTMDICQSIEELDLPGYRLHELKGNRKGVWSITVTGNWRLTFKNEDDKFTELDLEDYH